MKIAIFLIVFFFILKTTNSAYNYSQSKCELRNAISKEIDFVLSEKPRELLMLTVKNLSLDLRQNTFVYLVKLNTIVIDTCKGLKDFNELYLRANITSVVDIYRFGKMIRKNLNISKSFRQQNISPGRRIKCLM